MTDLVQRLNEPEDYYPGNFDTVKRANAMLSCLCQEAADALEAKDKEIARLEQSEALWRDDYSEMKALCDQLGEALEEAVYSNSTKKSQGLSVSALAAWKEMK